jgi:cytidylate kinase
MNFDVIAISRALGAGGEPLGDMLAKEFGLRSVDSEIIDRAAERVGATSEEVATSERRRGLLQRMLDSMARSGPIGMEVGMGTGTADVQDLGPDYPHVIVDVIREVATEGKCVLVAHGASHALADRPGTLRVLVTASPETRAKRLEHEAHGPGRARQMVEESDRARADFLKRFYQVEHESPTHYDLVFNTDALTPEDAFRAIQKLAATE